MQRARQAAAYWDANPDPLNQSTPSASHRHVDKLEAALLRTPDARFLEHHLGLRPGVTVLDLGSGHGAWSAHLQRRGAAVVSCDISQARCRELRAAHQAAGLGVRVVTADAAHIPLATESVDVVTARDLLMYVDPVRVVRECSRVLRPGGRLLISESLRATPLHGWLRRRRWPTGYAAFTEYLTFARLCMLGESGLTLRADRRFYLSAQLAFVWLYASRMPTGFVPLVSLLDRVDRVALWIPGCREGAWRGAVVYEKKP